MFEKKELKKRKNKIRLINNIGLILVFILLIIILIKYINGNFDIYNNFINEPNLNSNNEIKKTINNKRIPIIENRFDDKKENILIIGRGGYGNDAPFLTDSLILLSYYKEKKQISMLSIPRDLYVEYGDTSKNGEEIKAKINGLYIHYLAKYKDEEEAVAKLEEKIEEITGERIDYFVNIDFNGFVKLINSIDGVIVNVKKNLYDEKYPDNNHGFQTFSLTKGKQKLYGTTALKYVRSRHNSGGDFGRSERQQQVIKALKEKVLSSEYLTSPSKIKDLYNIFDKYISTDIGFIDFTKLATNLKLENNLLFYSSTINTSCIRNDECKKGGFLYYPQRKFFGGQSVLLPEGAEIDDLSNFEKINKYSDIVFNYPNLFKENFKISIFSKDIDKKSAIDLKQELKKYGLKINVLEKIGYIPANDKNISFKINKNKITLEEYNKLKNKKIDIKKYLENKNIKSIKKAANGIEEVIENENTKIIINGVDKNSNTIKFLKEYLNLENKDIIVNIDGPKYARDKKTKIEIIYKK